MALPTSRIALGASLLALGAVLGAGVSHWRAGASHDVPAAASMPVAAAPAASAAASAARQVLYWYDPMVPTQKFDKPGKSPFMDMQLVPRYADESPSGAPAAAGTLAVSAQARQALGVRLATVERRPIGASVEASATVQLNDRDVSLVQARTAGFVERVQPRATGDLVAAGAPLAWLLNPEWLGAQQEFLAVKATGDEVLTQAARQRLALLGMPAALVAGVERSGQPQALQPVVAATGGVITEWGLRAGMTVSPGQTLARINGLGTVWLEAALPEAQAAAVAPGQAVQARFPALPGEVLNGRVTAILPEASRDTRTLRLRIELPNPGGRLRPGLFAQVRLSGPPREALVLPSEAVIRTGRRSVVYLAEPDGRYRPVEVEVGEEIGDRITLRSGVQAGQQVVASGQFLIDSEASLQGVMARAAAPVYDSRGVVVEIEPGSITLEHEPVPALKWPAMTMPFKLAEPTLGRGLKKGQAVDFGFVQQGDDAVLTRIAPASGAAR